MYEGDRIVSLFSGCGGLDRGFDLAGYNIVFANDYADHVKETYERNHGRELLVEDIRELDYDSIPDCEGIIGGPPCQSWSLAGSLRGTDDERGSVFHDYVDIIDYKRPNFFVTENVPGIISKRNIDEFEEIIDRFREEMNYDVTYKKINAAHFNVPQARKRVIIVGIRRDLDYEYEFPDGTEEPMVQEEVLKGMPKSKPTEKEPHDPEELALPNHEHYVGDYSSRYKSRNRVRNWDEPAYTVIANARHQKQHPRAPKMVEIEKDSWKFADGHEGETGEEGDLYRRYSVREAARLQSFSDEFVFYYDGNINDGYKMVGNAVPVNLAKSIAESIRVDEVEGEQDDREFPSRPVNPDK